MRISELYGKEVIDISSGIHLGVIRSCDFLLAENGTIVSIVLPRRTDMIRFWGDRKNHVIRWENVKRIGSEILLVECDEKEEGFF